MSDTFDRDAARLVLQEWFGMNGKDKYVLDALEACVRPTPPQTIDRDALVELIMEKRDSAPRRPDDYDSEQLADDVLTLLRPVDGATS